MFTSAHPFVVAMRRITINDAPLGIVCDYDMHTLHNLTVNEGVRVH
jgi:hypothetical protein